MLNYVKRVAIFLRQLPSYDDYIPDSIAWKGQAFRMLKGSSSYFCNLVRGHGASQSEKPLKKKRKRKRERKKERRGKKRKARRGFRKSLNAPAKRIHSVFLLRALSTTFRPTFSLKASSTRRNIICKPGCRITFSCVAMFPFPSNQDQAAITYRFLRIAQRETILLMKPRETTSQDDPFFPRRKRTRERDTRRWATLIIHASFLTFLLLFLSWTILSNLSFSFSSY